MASVLVGDHGEVSLPNDVRRHYGIEPQQQVRVVETRGGILLIPLTGLPMGAELERELAEWQALGSDAIGDASSYIGR